MHNNFVMKHKIIFILHLPPPVHGAAMMGKYIYDSKIINDEFDCHYINLATAKDLTDIGRINTRKILQFIKLCKHICKEVKYINPDLVYVTPNSCGVAFYKDFIVVMLLKIMDQNIVIHYHNKGVSTRQNRLFDNILYRIFFKKVKVIQLASSLYNDVKKYVNKKDVYVCPNGIPVVGTSIKNVRRMNCEIQILFLSNMIASKGVWEVVEACKILKDSGVQFKCHFIGKWGDITEQEFYNKIIEEDLSAFVFAHGPRYGRDKIECFQKSDIFVFPTYYSNECFPIVLLEAMQQKLPCISTDEGGIPDIVEDGKTGYIVENKNAKQLAEKIIYLINHPNLCKEMGENGYKKYMSNYTLPIFETRLKNILSECCHES